MMTTLANTNKWRLPTFTTNLFHPIINEEEPPVSPNLINAEDHEMANLEIEVVENVRDFILVALSRHVEPGEAVQRAFLSVPSAQELSGIDIANTVENRYRIMSNFYHGDPDATYDNNFNPWDEVHLRINERKLNNFFCKVKKEHVLEKNIFLF